MKSTVLRFTGITGLILFGSVFIFTYYSPDYVEGAGKEFIKHQIEKETNEKIEALTLSARDGVLGRLAGKLYQNTTAGN